MPGTEQTIDLSATDLPRIWIRPYYASLNGLRAIAVTMVFFHHFDLWGVPGLLNATWEGVDLFFVLSGFLITGILFDSLEDPRYFRNFYVRRALRIFPLFYGFFALLFILALFVHLHWDRSLLALSSTSAI
jgi:peptidoglycan/LPS O-acetylase OafA/YrhL